jgi:hypothetical protein
MEERVVFWGGSPWHHFMYVHLLHKDGIMSEEDYKNYCDLLVLALPSIPLPIAGIHTRRETGEDTHLAIVERANNAVGEEKARRMEEVNVPISYWQSQIAYWIARMAEGLLLPKEIDNKLETPSPRIPILTANPNKTNWLTRNKEKKIIANDEGKRIILNQFSALLAQQQSLN